jgi:hypothetical protein
MSITRRRFVRTGLVAGVAIPVASLTGFAQKSTTPPSGGTSNGGTTPTTGDNLVNLTKADFAGAVATQFTIRLSALSTLKAELYMLTDDKNGEGTLATRTLDNYSLIFRGFHTTHLKQNSYQFEHPKLGNFLLFIVPAGTLGTAKLYQAVFNRM